MAGRGPAPKDASRRARRNADAIPQTILRQETCEPPELPEQYAALPPVVQWWNTWVQSPQAEVFGRTDWQFLVECLPLVKAYLVDGELKYAGELRLRMAKLGQTPEDRARLRMQFAQADEADRRRTPAGDARERYANLRVV